MNAIIRVQNLVSFYREFPGLTIDMLDSETDVTIQDLGALLDHIINDTQKTLFKKITDQGIMLTGKLDRVEANHKRLRNAVKDIGDRKGTCWCWVGPGIFNDVILHTKKCDAVYLALYGAERGE